MHRVQTRRRPSRPNTRERYSTAARLLRAQRVKRRDDARGVVGKSSFSAHADDDDDAGARRAPRRRVDARLGERASCSTPPRAPACGSRRRGRTAPVNASKAHFIVSASARSVGDVPRRGDVKTRLECRAVTRRRSRVPPRGLSAAPRWDGSEGDSHARRRRDVAPRAHLSHERERRSLRSETNAPDLDNNRARPPLPSDLSPSSAQRTARSTRTRAVSTKRGAKGGEHAIRRRRVNRRRGARLRRRAARSRIAPPRTPDVNRSTTRSFRAARVHRAKNILQRLISPLVVRNREHLRGGGSIVRIGVVAMSV